MGSNDLDEESDEKSIGESSPSYTNKKSSKEKQSTHLNSKEKNTTKGNTYNHQIKDRRSKSVVQSSMTIE